MKRSLSLTRIATLLACLTLWSFSAVANARFARPDLEKVPIERLAENLKKQIEAKPKDATLQVNLARLYAMAYALKTDTAEINRNNKGPLTPWFGYTPAHVPFQVKETEDEDNISEDQLKQANANLKLAIEHYKLAIELDKKNLTAQLGYAWCLEQAGKTMEAMDKYRETIENGWAAEKDLERGGLFFRSVTVEASEYLKKLLDEKADAKEIAVLDKRAEHIAKIPRPITPIAVALRAGLTADEIEHRTASVAFDADGSGEPKHWSWIHANAGWLVYDSQGSGQIDSALQMFGSVSFWCFWENGYQALAALDNDANGFLTGAELDNLAIWCDKNANGQSEPGEVLPLAEYNITRISCQFEKLHSHPEAIPYSAEGALTSDGRVLSTFDINLQRKLK